MPTYQYACTECGHRLEAVQSFSDAALTECPACHGKLRKVFNSVGIVFKGSGFYRNDSRPSEATASESSAKPAAEGKPAEKKTESTPAPAATTSSSSSASTTTSSKASPTAA